MQAARALTNFHISGVQLRLYPDLIKAFAMVKMAAARANFACGQFSREILTGIEKASQDMLEAARTGNWDQVLKLEGACALLISQLKQTASNEAPLGKEEAQFKSRIMQRILVNDAEIRTLAEPWLEDLDNILAGKPKTLH